MQKILKLSAPWCSPCKQMDVQLERLKPQLGELDIELIDLDVDVEFGKKYEVRSIPTLIKLDSDGKEIGRSVGAKTDAALLQFLL